MIAHGVIYLCQYCSIVLLWLVTIKLSLIHCWIASVRSPGTLSMFVSSNVLLPIDIRLRTYYPVGHELTDHFENTNRYIPRVNYFINVKFAIGKQRYNLKEEAMFIEKQDSILYDIYVEIDTFINWVIDWLRQVNIFSSNRKRQNPVYKSDVTYSSRYTHYIYMFNYRVWSWLNHRANNSLSALFLLYNKYIPRWWIW